MSDNLPWKTWTPDDLAPPPAEFVPMVESEETIIEEAEPSLEQQLAQLQSLHGWRLRGDPTLHPGGCKVSADEGDLDASVATRWQELCRLAAPGVV